MMNNPDSYPSRFGGEPCILPRLDPVIYGNTLEMNENIRQKAMFFEENGYVVFDNVFSEDEVDGMNKEIGLISDKAQGLKGDSTILEPESKSIRSFFYIHRSNQLFKRVAKDKRLVQFAENVLGGKSYIHQSRINLKPAFEGKEFFWHSDFETWHVEDGMPRMRALSCSVALTDNHSYNGPLMFIPGSHKHYVSCSGYTPADHFKKSLVKQDYGVPDRKQLNWLCRRYPIHTFLGKKGSVAFFDCNIMHGSSSNMTPYPRSNYFIVYNSIENRLSDPFGGREPRPEYIASRNYESVTT